jgi:hypothetical protein
MVIDRYKYLNILIPPGEPVKKEEPNILPIKLEDNMVNVTLASISPISQEVITVHKLADYRRRGHPMLLIPKVDCELDRLLKRGVSECTPTL